MNGRKQGGGQQQGRGGGQGQGRGGGMGSGGARGIHGECVCPQCGRREPHKRGIPCMDLKCPQCGGVMTRE